MKVDEDNLAAGEADIRAGTMAQSEAGGKAATTASGADMTVSQSLVGSSVCQSSGLIFSLHVCWASLFWFVVSFVNRLRFILVMNQLNFSSYKYISISFLS